MVKVVAWATVLALPAARALAVTSRAAAATAKAARATGKAAAAMSKVAAARGKEAMVMAAARRKAVPTEGRSRCSRFRLDKNYTERRGLRHRTRRLRRKCTYQCMHRRFVVAEGAVAAGTETSTLASRSRCC